MESTYHPTYVTGELHEISGVRYDVSVYRLADRYFASWICLCCPNHGETSKMAEAISAMNAAMEAIKLHHAMYHGAEPWVHVMGAIAGE